MPTMKNNTYWKKRSRQNKLKAIDVGENGINELKRILKTNLDDVQSKIKKFYDKYGENPAEKLSYQEFEKYKKILKANAKKYPEDKTLQKMAKQDIPKYRIDRLRQLETELQIRLAQITSYQETHIKGTLQDAAKVSHEAVKKMLKESIGLSIGAINSKQLNALIMQDWNGKNWSERIWTDRDKLGACVKNVLEKGITQGIGYRKLARELKENVKTSFNNAFRLIRTESAFIQGEINKTAYSQASDELGLEEYAYDAFLDAKTSTICRELNGRKFKISEMKIGVNAPPMHPNCRSTTQLLLENDYKEPIKKITEFKDLKTFNHKAYGLAEYVKNVEKNENEAVKYARSFFDKNTLNSFLSVGKLSKEQKQLLNAQTSDIKFSLDSMIKNRIKHNDVNYWDYAKIPDILGTPDKIISDGKQHIKIFKTVDDKIYEAVIKTTRDKKENFLVSLHYSNQRRMKKQF